MNGPAFLAHCLEPTRMRTCRLVDWHNPGILVCFPPVYEYLLAMVVHLHFPLLPLVNGLPPHQLEMEASGYKCKYLYKYLSYWCSLFCLKEDYRDGKEGIGSLQEFSNLASNFTNFENSWPDSN